MSDPVIVKLQGFDKATWNAALLLASKDSTDAKFSVLDPSSIRFKMSNTEKQQKKQEYRRAYRKRPEVVKRLELKNNDPTVIAARKLYAEDPEVKQRKKEYAAARRKLLQEMKCNHSDLYNELKSKIMPPPKQRAKRSLADAGLNEEAPRKKQKRESTPVKISEEETDKMLEEGRKNGLKTAQTQKTVQFIKDVPSQRSSTIKSFSLKK